VSSGEAPPNMHDEFAQLLIEGLPFTTTTSTTANNNNNEEEYEVDESSVSPHSNNNNNHHNNMISIDHTINDLEIQNDDPESIKLYKIYRKKLQHFLASSYDYHPAKILKLLPRAYLHENALVLSRLGRHRDVLIIYWKSLKNVNLAEGYCNQIYQVMIAHSMNNTNNITGGGPDPVTMNNNKGGKKSSFSSSSMTSIQPLPSNLVSSGEIYLILFQVRELSHICTLYLILLLLLLLGDIRGRRRSFKY
jgi:hypothetical protein